VLDILQNNWGIIALECGSLQIDSILDASTCTDRRRILEALKNKCDASGSSAWVSGWDGYTGWLNWGICIDYQFPLGDVGMPKTVALLKQYRGIKFASISLLRPSQIMNVHYHPEMQSEGLLTYHLGLNVPHECYLNCDGEFIKEENGKSFIFDGSLPHYAFNASSHNRFILHCEVLASVH